MCPIYDYECEFCGRVHERIEKTDDDRPKECPECGVATARRVISVSGQYCANEDANWLKSVTDIVGDDTRAGRQFKERPTRSNYRAWLKETGLRPLERGEKPRRPAPLDEARITRQLMERHMRRKAIEIR